MRVARLKMYQEMARFNNPSAPKGADCYPLPPFSTVNGFIHSMCQWKRYHKLDFLLLAKEFIILRCKKNGTVAIISTKLAMKCLSVGML